MAILHTAKLGEGAVGRLVAPDALRGRKHRVAAVAFLIVAVVLVAVDHNLVADLPALHFGADGINDAGGVGAGDMVGLLVPVERGDRLAERGPHAVVVHPRRHHEHQDVVAVELPGGHDLHLHRALGGTMAFLANGPGVHGFGYVAERWDLSELIKILKPRAESCRCYPVGSGFLRGSLVVSYARRFDTGFGLGVHSHDSLLVDGKDSPCRLMLHCRTCATFSLRSSEISAPPRC